MVKKLFIIMIMIGIALLPACLMRYDDPFKISPDTLYCKEYDQSCEGNIDTDYYYGRNADFAIGANRKNIAVFKDPHQAFAAFRRLYWKELLIVQFKYFLLPIGESIIWPMRNTPGKAVIRKTISSYPAFSISMTTALYLTDVSRETWRHYEI